MKLVSSKPVGQRRVYDIEVADVHNFYANGVNVHNCATDGGVSIINGPAGVGTVVDIVITQTKKGASHIRFVEDNKVAFFAQQSSASGKYWRYVVGEIPSADISRGYWNDYISLDEWNIFPYGYYVGSYPVLAPQDWTVGATTALASSGDIGGNTGLTKFSLADPETLSMVAYVASSYNTGWMNGDIKLATLSDTDDTDVTGTELVTNGTFDTDISGWTNFASSRATVSWDSGTLKVDNTTGSGDGYVYQTGIGFVTGKAYVITATFSNHGNENAKFYFVTSGGGVIGTVMSKPTNTDGTVTFTATAGATANGIMLGSADISTAWNLDNVSVRLAEEDRSVNGNGLQVFGTVTKTPVATGADLVAYSGFSSSNYLQQPYYSGLDFGTGDFCVMGWFKTSGNAMTMFERCASPRSGTGMTIYMDVSGKPIWYKIVGGVPSAVVTPTGSYNNNTWVHFAVIRQSGVVSLYFNGQSDGSASDSTDMTNASAILKLGSNITGTSGWNGSMALWRTSATAPTAEQIAKIYEDEKVLFQEGAQATLYGSSDAVTALAYDDDTELLHVGTSAGRSVFSGLRRVDNTTDAVGSAISASNGMVVED